MNEYDQGGVINPDREPIPVTLELGERLITAQGDVYQLERGDGGPRWVHIGTGIELWMEERPWVEER